MRPKWLTKPILSTKHEKQIGLTKKGGRPSPRTPPDMSCIVLLILFSLYG
jgi:hypothetical protein